MGDMIELAKAVCMKAHSGQVDKAGEPYYLHPFAVAKSVEGDVGKCVAYLHDVVEDTDISFADLSRMGFPDEIVEAVDAITRRDDEGYVDFILRCRNNETARIVKLADLSHNTDPSRKTSLPESLSRRYEKAKRILLFED